MNKLKITGLIAILTIAGIFFAGTLYLDSIVKSAIQQYGPQILQVPVQVENVSLSPLTGSGTIENLTIGNPDGFESDYLIRIGVLSIDMDITTLLSQHITIENLLLQDMHIIYERNSGTTNVAAFEELMAGAPSADPDSETESQAMTINRMVIDESRLTLQASLLGDRSVDVKIPRTEREQISSEDNTVAGVVKIALDPVLQSIKNAGSQAIQKAGKSKVKDKVKGIFNNN